MKTNESCHGRTGAIHPSGGLSNTGSALNNHDYLRSAVAHCFFQDYIIHRQLVMIGTVRPPRHHTAGVAGSIGMFSISFHTHFPPLFLPISPSTLACSARSSALAPIHTTRGPCG